MILTDEERDKALKGLSQVLQSNPRILSLADEIEKIISIDMTEKERVVQISRILSTVSFTIVESEEDSHVSDEQIKNMLAGRQMNESEAMALSRMDESAEKIKQMEEKETIRKRGKLLWDRAQFGWSADTFAKARGLDPEKLSKCFYCADYFEDLFECDYCKDSYCEEHRLTEDHRCEKSYQPTDDTGASQYNKKHLTRHRGKKGWFQK